MTWKVISLEFNTALSEQQERLLIAQFKTITEKMVKTVKSGVGAYDNPLIRGAIKAAGGEAVATGARSQLQFIADNMYEYVRLEKSEKVPNAYEFRVKENALRISAPMGQTVDIWKKLQKKFDLKFKLELCRVIGILPGNLKLTFSEIID